MIKKFPDGLFDPGFASAVYHKDLYATESGFFQIDVFTSYLTVLDSIFLEVV